MQVQDPVCKMRIDSNRAAFQERHGDLTLYFCSKNCHESFIANPSKFIEGSDTRKDEPKRPIHTDSEK